MKMRAHGSVSHLLVVVWHRNIKSFVFCSFVSFIAGAVVNNNKMDQKNSSSSGNDGALTENQQNVARNQSALPGVNQIDTPASQMSMKSMNGKKVRAPQPFKPTRVFRTHVGGRRILYDATPNGPVERPMVQSQPVQRLPVKRRLVVTKRAKSTRQMVFKAIQDLAEPDGSSMAKIKRFVREHFDVNPKFIDMRIRKFLRKAYDDGELVQKKRKSFNINQKFRIAPMEWVQHTVPRSSIAIDAIQIVNFWTSLYDCWIVANC